MLRLRIGDNVKVVRVDNTEIDGEYVGKTGRITRYSGGSGEDHLYEIKTDISGEDQIFWEHELEFIDGTKVKIHTPIMNTREALDIVLQLAQDAVSREIYCETYHAQYIVRQDTTRLEERSRQLEAIKSVRFLTEVIN
jgi:hypothetical protein